MPGDKFGFSDSEGGGGDTQGRFGFSAAITTSEAARREDEARERRALEAMQQRFSVANLGLDLKAVRASNVDDMALLEDKALREEQGVVARPDAYWNQAPEPNVDIAPGAGDRFPSESPDPKALEQARAQRVEQVRTNLQAPGATEMPSVPAAIGKMALAAATPSSMPATRKAAFYRSLQQRRLMAMMVESARLNGNPTDIGTIQQFFGNLYIQATQSPTGRAGMASFLGRQAVRGAAKLAAKTLIRQPATAATAPIPYLGAATRVADIALTVNDVIATAGEAAGTTYEIELRNSRDEKLRKGEPLTEDEMLLTRTEAYEASLGGKTMLGSLGSAMPGMFQYSGRFAGVGNPALNAAGSKLSWLRGKSLATQALPKALQLRNGVARSIVGGVVTMAANPRNYVAVQSQLAPAITFALSPEADEIVAQLDSRSGQTFAQAFGKALGDELVGSMFEGMGSVADILTAPVKGWAMRGVSGLAGKALRGATATAGQSALKKSVVGVLAATGKLFSFAPHLTEFSWDGILNETIVEELIPNLLITPIFTGEWRNPVSAQGGREALSTLLSMTILGVSGGGAGAAISAIGELSQTHQMLKGVAAIGAIEEKGGDKGILIQAPPDVLTKKANELYNAQTALRSIVTGVDPTKATGAAALSHAQAMVNLASMSLPGVDSGTFSEGAADKGVMSLADYEWLAANKDNAKELAKRWSIELAQEGAKPVYASTYEIPLLDAEGDEVRRRSFTDRDEAMQWRALASAFADVERSKGNEQGAVAGSAMATGGQAATAQQPGAPAAAAAKKTAPITQFTPDNIPIGGILREDIIAAARAKRDMLLAKKKAGGKAWTQADETTLQALQDGLTYGAQQRERDDDKIEAGAIKLLAQHVMPTNRADADKVSAAMVDADQDDTETIIVPGVVLIAANSDPSKGDLSVKFSQTPGLPLRRALLDNGFVYQRDPNVQHAGTWVRAKRGDYDVTITNDDQPRIVRSRESDATAFLQRVVAKEAKRQEVLAKRKGGGAPAPAATPTTPSTPPPPSAPKPAAIALAELLGRDFDSYMTMKLGGKRKRLKAKGVDVVRQKVIDAMLPFAQANAGKGGEVIRAELQKAIDQLLIAGSTALAGGMSGAVDVDVDGGGRISVTHEEMIALRNASRMGSKKGEAEARFVEWRRRGMVEAMGGDALVSTAGKVRVAPGVVIRGASVTQPYVRYVDAQRGQSSGRNIGKNLWVRQRGSDTRNRTLIVVHSEMMWNHRGDAVEAALERVKEGRHVGLGGPDLGRDFATLPVWVAKIAALAPDADLYVVRDVDEYLQFLPASAYENVVIDVTGVPEGAALAAQVDMLANDEVQRPRGTGTTTVYAAAHSKHGFVNAPHTVQFYPDSDGILGLTTPEGSPFVMRAPLMSQAGSVGAQRLTMDFRHFARNARGSADRAKSFGAVDVRVTKELARDRDALTEMLLEMSVARPDSARVIATGLNSAEIVSTLAVVNQVLGSATDGEFRGVTLVLSPNQVLDSSLAGSVFKTYRVATVEFGIDEVGGATSDLQVGFGSGALLSYGSDRSLTLSRMYEAAVRLRKAGVSIGFRLPYMVIPTRMMLEWRDGLKKLRRFIEDVTKEEQLAYVNMNPTTDVEHGFSSSYVVALDRYKPSDNQEHGLRALAEFYETVADFDQRAVDMALPQARAARSEYGGGMGTGTGTPLGLLHFGRANDVLSALMDKFAKSSSVKGRSRRELAEAAKKPANPNLLLRAANGSMVAVGERLHGLDAARQAMLVWLNNLGIEGITEARGWYERAYHEMVMRYGEDNAAMMLLAFAVSQKNTSPADGFEHITAAFENWMRDENGGGQVGAQIVAHEEAMRQELERQMRDVDVVRLADGRLAVRSVRNGDLVASKLPEQLYRMVRTPMFKAWFGDWEEAARQGQRQIHSLERAQQVKTREIAAPFLRDIRGIVDKMRDSGSTPYGAELVRLAVEAFGKSLEVDAGFDSGIDEDINKLSEMLGEYYVNFNNDFYLPRVTVEMLRAGGITTDEAIRRAADRYENDGAFYHLEMGNYEHLRQTWSQYYGGELSEKLSDLTKELGRAGIRLGSGQFALHYVLRLVNIEASLSLAKRYDDYAPSAGEIRQKGQEVVNEFLAAKNSSSDDDSSGGSIISNDQDDQNSRLFC